MQNIAKSLIILLLIGNSLFGGVSRNTAIIKVVGVDRLPYDVVGGYDLSMDGVPRISFFGGIKYYHASRGFLVDINNGVATKEIFECDDTHLYKFILEKTNDPDYKKFITKKRVPCNQTTIIRIR
jgi:hypothetical protein